MSIIFETQNICKSYGSHKAIENISLQIKEQSIFGLLGPNGAGKSTLLRIINRIINADSGRLLMDGHAMSDLDLNNIGYLPEERGLYKKMTVGDQALYLAQLKGLDKRTATQRLRSWFDKLGIASWWNRRVEELSKGMQQKVQFIVTVLHEPRLLIFDEPFSGFDPMNADILKREILELRDKGATVIFSTHNMSSVEELCDSIALVNSSKVVLDGTVSEIKQSFKQNLFEVELSPKEETIKLPESWNASMVDRSSNGERWNIKLPADTAANDLLTILLPQANIVSLKEILPSMNEIFINTVKQ